MDTMSMFDYIMLAMGVYVLIGGIRGKGRLYTVENIKEELVEQFVKTMRKLYIALGAVMTLNGLVSVAKSMLYDYVEVSPATGATTAAYDYVPKQDLGAFSFLTIPVINIIMYVCTGLAIAGIVVMIIITRKMTDKDAAAKRAAQQAESAAANPQAGHTLPVAAFDFSEDETVSASDAEPNQTAEEADAASRNQ